MKDDLIAVNCWQSATIMFLSNSLPIKLFHAIQQRKNPAVDVASLNSCGNRKGALRTLWHDQQ